MKRKGIAWLGSIGGTTTQFKNSTLDVELKRKTSIEVVCLAEILKTKRSEERTGEAYSIQKTTEEMQAMTTIKSIVCKLLLPFDTRGKANSPVHFKLRVSVTWTLKDLISVM